MSTPKCCHFFHLIFTAPVGVVTVMRRHIAEHELINWSQCNAGFQRTNLHVASNGTIEDQGVGLLQVDFANKFLGGGVLGHGCVQEEIRFVICPELFVTKLIVESMLPTEAVFVIGCERYNDYDGYASQFFWKSDFVDDTPFDESRRRQCAIVAIDAINFVNDRDQYREHFLLRELNKVGRHTTLHEFFLKNFKYFNSN